MVDIACRYYFLLNLIQYFSIKNLDQTYPVENLEIEESVSRSEILKLAVKIIEPTDEEISLNMDIQHVSFLEMEITGVSDDAESVPKLNLCKYKTIAHIYSCCYAPVIIAS